MLRGEAGNDTLVGGAGTDTAQYAYHSQYYRPIGTNALDFRLESTRFEEGTDRLLLIEWLQFQNERVSVSDYLARFATGGTTSPIVVAPPDPTPVTPVIPTPSPTGLPKLYFHSQSFAEENSGSRVVNLEVRLDKAATTPVTFMVSAAQATDINAATAGSDFEAFYARTFTIPAGQLTVGVPVRIFGDTRVEANEVFNVAISNVSGAQLAQGPYVDVERISSS